MVDLIYDILLATVFYLLIECPFGNVFERVFRSPRPEFKKPVIHEAKTKF